MLKKNLEIFDPENPPIYYYTSDSLKKPRSIKSECKSPRTRLGRPSSKLMLLFAGLYVIYLFYLAIEKPHFALQYVANENRQVLFSSKDINVVGSFSIPHFSEQGLLQLTFYNRSDNPSFAIISKAQYYFSDNPQFVSTLNIKSPLSLKEKERFSVSFPIPLEKESHKDKKKLSVILMLKNEESGKEESRTLHIEET